MATIQDLGKIIVSWNDQQRKKVAGLENKLDDEEKALLSSLISQPMVNQQSQETSQDNNVINDLVKTNPHAKGAIKALEETGYEQAKEAITMGVPPDKLISDLLAMRGTQGEVSNQPVVANQQISDTTSQETSDQLQQRAMDILNRKPKTTIFGVLSDLLTMGTATPNLEAKRKNQELGQIAAVQKITGTEPLQKGEREKLEMAGITSLATELAKKKSTDPLTPENAQKFSLLMEGNDSVLKINDLLGSDITSKLLSLGVPQFLKSQEAKELESNIEQAVQAKTRIETGAALQPQELKNTVKRYMPRVGDTQETARKRLRSLNTFFERAINTADPTGEHRNRAAGSNKNIDVNAAIEELKRRGVKI